MNELRPRIEQPRHDSIYDYILNKLIPEDVTLSPFYKLLTQMGVVLNDKYRAEDRVTVRIFLTDNVIDCLKIARNKIITGYLIYSNILKILTYDNNFPDGVKEDFYHTGRINQYSYYYTKVHYLLEQYNDYYPMYEWISFLTKWYKRVKQSSLDPESVHVNILTEEMNGLQRSIMSIGTQYHSDRDRCDLYDESCDALSYVEKHFK